MKAPVKLIQSRANPLFRDLRRAARSGGLTSRGLALAEGPHLLAEALRSEVDVDSIVLSRSFAARFPAPGASILRYVLEDALFQELATTESSQGILTLIRPPHHDLADLLTDPAALLVILDRMQDPGNAGTIIRSAEAFGASGVVLLTGSAHLWHPKTLRAAAGSSFRLPCVERVQADDLLAALPANPIALYAAGAQARRTLEELDWRQACALIVGNEGAGIAEPLAAAAEGFRIATRQVESLNAATAAGIALYEARRQRGW